MVIIPLEAFTDLLAKLRQVKPEVVWPDHADAEKRIRFRNNPFIEFLLADDTSKRAIFSIISE